MFLLSVMLDSLSCSNSFLPIHHHLPIFDSTILVSQVQIYDSVNIRNGSTVDGVGHLEKSLLKVPETLNYSDKYK